MGTLVQIVSNDPAPSNIGNIGAAGGLPHVRIASPSGFTSGNILVGIGGTANFAGSTWSKFADPVMGNWTTLQHLNARSAPNGVTDGEDIGLAWIQLTSNIAPGFVGLINASSSTTLQGKKFDGTSPGWTTNQWAGATCQDYSTGSPITVISNTSDTLTFSSTTAPGVGNPFSVGGYVASYVSSAGEDYTAATVEEWSGVSGVIGSSANQNVFTSGQTLSTGTIAAWSGTGSAISFGLDDEDDGTGTYNPLADPTNVDDGVLWKWNISTAVMRAQHKVVTSPGSPYGMNFTTQVSSDHHMAFLVVLQDAGSGNGAAVAWLHI